MPVEVPLGRGPAKVANPYTQHAAKRGLPVLCLGAGRLLQAVSLHSSESSCRLVAARPAEQRRKRTGVLCQHDR